MMLRSIGMTITLAAALLLGLPGGTVAAAQTEAEPNSTRATATPIALNQPATGYIADTTDTDYYQIQLDEAGIVSLHFRHPEIADQQMLWQGELETAQGQAVATFGSTGTETEVETQAVGLAPGTYYVRIHAGFFVSHDATYTLTVQNTPQSQSDIWYEQEGANETTDQAMALPSGQAVTGNIHQLGDLDYYCFTLPKSGTFSLEMEHPTQETAQSYWNVTLYDASGQQVYIYSIVGNGQIFHTSSLPLSAGTYYLRVTHGTAHTTDTYTLTAFYAPTQSAEPDTQVLLGDVDLDGSITIQDAYQALMAYAASSAGLADGLTAQQRLAADVDTDGAITIQDAYRILRYYAEAAAGNAPSWT